MLLLFAFACTKGEDPEGVDWLLDVRDAGQPLALGQGFDPQDPTETYFAAQHFVPDLYYGNSPASEIPLLLWDHLLGDNIADTGICPYLSADGPELIYTGNCRSAEGYDWIGEVRQIEWDEEGQSWQHWEFDLIVETELEDKSFERISLVGELFYASMNEDIGLVSHTQTNVQVEAQGYWANKSVNGENLELAWSELALTGVWETQDIDTRTYVHAGVVDLGDFGGFTFDSEGLVDQGAGCIGEPKGKVTLSGDGDATLRFEGQERCDGCAEHTADGDTTLACASREYLL